MKRQLELVFSLLIHSWLMAMFFYVITYFFMWVNDSALVIRHNPAEKPQQEIRI